MSDRKNRDRGNKNAKRKGNWYCGCWLCISDREKKRRILDKSNDRSLSKKVKSIYATQMGTI